MAAPSRIVIATSGSLFIVTAPIAAVELEISPATGACTTTVPPSGNTSRASVKRFGSVTKL